MNYWQYYFPQNTNYCRTISVWPSVKYSELNYYVSNKSLKILQESYLTCFISIFDIHFLKHELSLHDLMTVDHLSNLFLHHSRFCALGKTVWSDVSAQLFGYSVIGSVTFQNCECLYLIMSWVFPVTKLMVPWEVPLTPSGKCCRSLSQC